MLCHVLYSHDFSTQIMFLMRYCMNFWPHSEKVFGSNPIWSKGLVLLCLVCMLCVHLCFLWVLWVFSTVQKHGSVGDL